ncbi:MAG: NAD-dependent DNA ligase LigA [Planctomycetota bacterium]|nr:NAD-dependent DNA ligase LigA [Planctomycetota bacterium]
MATRKPARPSIRGNSRKEPTLFSDDPEPKSLEDEAEELARQLAYHDFLYWGKNSPEISDAAYDQLRERLRQVAPDHPQLSKLGERTRWKDELHPPVRHAGPMLSIEKCFTPEDVVAWATDAGAFRSEADDDGIVACYKIDGSSCSLVYKNGELLRAVTRGDGKMGNDITLNARRIPSIPQTVESDVVFEVRGEIYFTKEAYEEAVAANSIDPNTTNPRNLCAGTILQNDPRAVEKMNLSFVAHGYVGVPPGSDGRSEASNLAALHDNGFEIPLFRHITRPDDVAPAVHEIDATRDGLPYETDGVVFTINRVSLQRELGLTTHHPRYRLAFKFGRQQGETAVRRIHWETSRSGRVCPRMEVETIRLGGANVTSCTLHNAKTVKELGLKPGDKVLLEREVIPHLVRKTADATVGGADLPQHCDRCDSTLVWDETGTNLVCPNFAGCPSQLQDYLEYYCSRGVTNMMGLGQEIIAALVEGGLIGSPADFFLLSHGQVMDCLDKTRAEKAEAKRKRTGVALKGRTTKKAGGAKLAENVIAAIQARREQTLEVFLVSLGIRGLGPSVAARLTAHFGTLDALLAASQEKLQEVEGVAETMAAAIHDGLRHRQELIAALLTHVSLRQAEKAEGPLSGKSFCLTGHVEFDYGGTHYDARPAIEALIKSKGGTIKSVSKGLSYLIAGEEAGSKLEKAKKAGIQVIGAAELVKMLR